MIKVAMVKANGEVAYTISPAVDDMYIHGETYNGCVARHIAHTSDDQDVLKTWYWDGISGSDWTQFPDSPLTTAKKAEWATYRQSLRDIPETYADVTSLDDIIWPIKPE